MNTQDRYAAITAEAAQSRHAEMLMELFWQLHTEHEVPVEVIIRNAFAQGVAVGIEMERIEITETKGTSV